MSDLAEDAGVLELTLQGERVGYLAGVQNGRNVLRERHESGRQKRVREI